MTKKAQATGIRVCRGRSSQVENRLPDKNLVIFSSFSSQMKVDDQKLKQKRRKKR